MTIKHLLFAAAALTLGLAGCRSIQPIAAPNPGAGTVAAIGEAGPEANPTAAAARLSAADAEALTFLREEEKLAHDVYTTFAELWDAPLFSNIVESESSHTTAVQRLLEQYGVPDPAADNPIGVFSDPTLQDLYDELVEQGSASLIAALEVGGYIEEMDILDLRAKASDVAGLERLFDNLERGSTSHLKAFVRNLEKAGEPYQPQLMSADVYETIVAGETDTGGGAAPGASRLRPAG
ncbi:MAG: DUF2202 domain-containing protein [Acidimicrobiia bacterium]|nr:DUF2202 domain-containing protein [Acidimicrobiia bacterium]NNF11173.1 DUF2202 domain-containing protein [Acidimicrobiia bacterium]NNL71443.1 DUF2202 domain-containing protein [Acidimicrobiia bacterium]